MQVCISLHSTDNHASTPSLKFFTGRMPFLSPNQQHQSTHTHTHTFNGPLSGTTQVSRYQTGKTNLDFTGATDSEWQWHQLGHMKVCTLLQIDNHASTPLTTQFFTGRMLFLPPNQQHQSTEGKSNEGKYFSISLTKYHFFTIRCRNVIVLPLNSS